MAVIVVVYPSFPIRDSGVATQSPTKKSYHQNTTGTQASTSLSQHVWRHVCKAAERRAKNILVSATITTIVVCSELLQEQRPTFPLRICIPLIFYLPPLRSLTLFPADPTSTAAPAPRHDHLLPARALRPLPPSPTDQVPFKRLYIMLGRS